MRTSAGLLLICGIGVAGASAAASGDPAAGERKSATCAGCHGIAGYRNAYPPYSVPKLGGQHADYLASALSAYKSGQRAHPTMQAVAATLSEQDIADLAAYFSRPPGDGKP